MINLSGQVWVRTLGMVSDERVRRSGLSAAITSTLAGRGDTLESLPYANVRFVVVATLLRSGPIRVRRERMNAQIVDEQQALGAAQPRHHASLEARAAW